MTSHSDGFCLDPVSRQCEPLAFVYLSKATDPTQARSLPRNFQFIPSIFLPSYAAVIDSKPNGTTLVALMNAGSFYVRPALSAH